LSDSTVKGRLLTYLPVTLNHLWRELFERKVEVRAYIEVPGGPRVILPKAGFIVEGFQRKRTVVMRLCTSY